MLKKEKERKKEKRGEGKKEEKNPQGTQLLYTLLRKLKNEKDHATLLSSLTDHLKAVKIHRFYETSLYDYT